MEPKLIVYAKDKDQPAAEVPMRQFDPKGNPKLFFVDVTIEGTPMRIFVDLDPHMVEEAKEDLSYGLSDRELEVVGQLAMNYYARGDFKWDPTEEVSKEERALQESLINRFGDWIEDWIGEPGPAIELGRYFAAKQ